MEIIFLWSRMKFASNTKIKNYYGFEENFFICKVPRFMRLSKEWFWFTEASHGYRVSFKFCFDA